MPDASGKIVGTNLSLDAVEVGLASSFRQDINNNSEAIVREVDDIYNEIARVNTNLTNTINQKESAIYAAMVNIQVSKNQPTNQKAGDLWFQIIDG